MPSRRHTIALLVDYVVSTYQVSLMRGVERATSELDVNLLVIVGRSFNAPAVGDRTQTRLYELLTEAMNEKQEQFGLDRLCRLVRAQGHRTAHQIADAIIAEAQAWQTSQLDDLTVVVARHNR